MAKGLYINPTKFVPLNQISADLTSEVATRQFAMGGYAGFFTYLPDPDPILRRLGADQEVYKDLISDDQVGPMVIRRKNLTKSQNWDVDQGEGATDKEMDLCRYALKILEGNNCKTKDLISQSLNPILFGYSVFEIVWGSVGSYILPVKVQEKPREWFFFDTENQLRFRTVDNFEGILLTGPNADPAMQARFILLQNDPTYENPYGDKALSRCFWPVTFKRGGMRFFTIFVEKYGMPFMYGKLPRTASLDATNDLLSKLSNMVQDAVAVIPDDSSVGFLETKGTASADIYDRYLNRCNNSISKAILTNALSTEIQQTGARATTETGANTIEGNLADEDKDFPSTLFNELFKRIIDFNIGTGSYPVFNVFEEEEVKKDLSERDKNLDTIGVKFTKKYFQKTYNLDDEDFELGQSTDPKFPLNKGGQGGLSPDNKLELSTNTVKRMTAKPNDDKQMSGLRAVLSNIWKRMLGKNIQLSASEKDEITEMIDSLPAQLLQFQMEETLQPVIQLIQGGSSYEEVQNKLAELYPQMKTDQLQNLLQKTIFISELWGRANDENNEV